MKHAFIGGLILLLGLIIGSVADQLWTRRTTQAETIRMEQRRQAEPLLRFGASLPVAQLDAPRPPRASVYVPAYASIRMAHGRSMVQLAATLSIHNTSRDRPLILERIDY